MKTSTIIWIIFFVLLSFFRPYPLRASTPIEGSVGGDVAEQSSGRPVEYATIAVYRLPDSTVVTGCITDSLGRFKVSNLAPSKYFVKVSFIGFTDYYSPVIEINDKKQMEELKVFLWADAKLLKEVSVEVEKELVVASVDKKVFNVDKDILSKNGSAAEALQNIPSVQVDFDGNVSMRNGGTVQVLVDGKPSAASQAGLQNIPASSIEKIEVVSNPSVKNDADGVSGIINIVLKKNKMDGLNAGITLGAGIGKKYNGALNMNYRQGKYNFYINYSMNENPRWLTGGLERHIVGVDTAFVLYQDMEIVFRRNTSHQLKAGTEILLSPTIEFSLSGGINASGNVRDDMTNSSYADSRNEEYMNFDRDLVIEAGNMSWDINVNASKKFKKPGNFMNADVYFSRGTNALYRDSYWDVHLVDYQPYNMEAGLEKAYNKAVADIYSFQLDWGTVTAKGVKIEAGYKAFGRQMSNSIHYWDYVPSDNTFHVNDSLLSSYRFNENIHSVYGNSVIDFKEKGKLIAGVRAEYWGKRFDLQSSDSLYSKEQLNVFPNISYTRKLRGNVEGKLSYSLRVNRPQVFQLNPIPDRTDPSTLKFGNPHLDPEKVHVFEAVFSTTVKSITINPALYHHLTIKGFAPVVIMDTLGNALVYTDNLLRGNSSGIDLFVRAQIRKWGTLSGSLNMFYHRLRGEAGGDLSFDNDNRAWNGRITAGVNLPYKLQLQLTGNYNSKMITPQGEIFSNYSVNAGLKKALFKGAGSISLAVSDIFDTAEFGIYLEDYNFYGTAWRKRESRVATVSFSWNIGKQTAPGTRRNNHHDQALPDSL